MDLSRIKKQDWLITVAIFLLLLVGLVVIYSSTFNAKTAVEGAGTINRQLIFVILGFFIYFVIMCIDPVFYRYFPIQVLIFVIIVGLLLYVLVFGDPIRNTNRWIEWGFIRIQPSEYAKVALILLNSSVLMKLFKEKTNPEVNWVGKKKPLNPKDKLKRISNSRPEIITYVLASGITLLCIVLIFRQPALGNALITGMICLSLFLVSFPHQKLLSGILVTYFLSINVIAGIVNFNFLYDRFDFSLFVNGFDLGIIIFSISFVVFLVFLLRLKIIPIILAAIVGVVSVLSFTYMWDNVLKDYQRQRVEVFFNPEEDPTDAGWQLRQSKIAIGSGRFFGKGFLQGSQSKLRYLPEAYSDFVFAAFCEEFGLVGALFIFSVYAFLIFRIIMISRRANSPYESLICFGVAFMLLIHVFINVGMNMGMFPITGIPLPLISYGGSSIMITMSALGLVQTVNNYRDSVDMQESLMTKDVFVSNGLI